MDTLTCQASQAGTALEKIELNTQTDVVWSDDGLTVFTVNEELVISIEWSSI